MTYWAPEAWLNGWRERVLLHESGGVWSEIVENVAAPPGATILAGPAMPGVVNAHSHAFQRAFAGLAEHREAERDDFWTWRDRMYRVAGLLNPEQMRIVARQLYGELLLGGYTHVCEFHYLHRKPDGTDYPDRLAMMHALIAGAADTGIGLTMIPVIYERAGFDMPSLRDDQRPFRMSAAEVIEAARSITASRTLTSAIGAHSLRAATPESIRELLTYARKYTGPIHIHVAEQTGEVDACLRTTGKRPVEWLASEKLLDARWQLVHATHTTEVEREAIAKTGAGVVLCPNTEANLGDGIVEAPTMIENGIPISIGSDSQIARTWTDEFRMIEYSQRLKHRQRCLTTNGERLYSLGLAGGGRAAGFDLWGLQVGARADLVIVENDELPGIPRANRIDSMIFSTPNRPIRDVIVAGRFVVQNRQNEQQNANRSEFLSVMRSLWS